MKKTAQQYYLILIIFISLFAFRAHNAFAANVSFALPPSVNTGENLDVLVNADSGGILVNSVEFTISYDQNLLSFSGYSDNSSVVKLWMNPPHADNGLPAQTGKISMSGIIPGGVLGLYDANKQGLGPIPIVHLLFTAKNSGTASFSFVDSKILEADGLGTPLSHNNIGASIDIKLNPNGTTKVVSATTSNTPKNTPNSSIPSRIVFWVIILLLVAGFLGYKLLKYKHETLVK